MTVIETTKIFGVVSLKADSTSWKGLVGTTAEIFEYIDADDNIISNEDPRSVGLKMRVRGRQRFKLVSTRRQVDGNLVGGVQILFFIFVTLEVFIISIHFLHLPIITFTISEDEEKASKSCNISHTTLDMGHVFSIQPCAQSQAGIVQTFIFITEHVLSTFGSDPTIVVGNGKSSL